MKLYFRKKGREVSTLIFRDELSLQNIFSFVTIYSIHNKKKETKNKNATTHKKKRKKKETKSLNFPKRYETKLPGLEGNFFFWHTENFFKIFTQVTQFPNSPIPVNQFASLMPISKWVFT